VLKATLSCLGGAEPWVALSRIVQQLTVDFLQVRARCRSSYPANCIAQRSVILTWQLCSVAVQTRYECVKLHRSKRALATLNSQAAFNSKTIAVVRCMTCTSVLASAIACMAENDYCCHTCFSAATCWRRPATSADCFLQVLACSLPAAAAAL
jgi:hypothetical protein